MEDLTPEASGLRRTSRFKQSPWTKFAFPCVCHWHNEIVLTYLEPMQQPADKTPQDNLRWTGSITKVGTSWFFEILTLTRGRTWVRPVHVFQVSQEDEQHHNLAPLHGQVRLGRSSLSQLEALKVTRFLSKCNN